MHPLDNTKGVDNSSYLFVKIPKTASTSICKVLPFPFPHKTAIEWKRELKNFDELFKFTIVRNPYDRFISMFYFFGVFNRHNFKDPNEFLEKVNWGEFNKRGDAIFARPQSDYICHNDKIMVDYIGKFETLEKDWDYISDKIRVSKRIPHLRKCRSEKAALSDISKETLYKIYKKDFEVLGY